MNCERFALILEATRDGRSGVGDAGLRSADFDLHASTCAACANLSASEDRLVAALASLRVSSRVVPLHFEARVRRAVRAVHAAPEPRRFAWPLLASGLASAVALGAIVAVSLRDTRTSPSAAITAAAAPLAGHSPTNASHVVFSDARVEVSSLRRPELASPASPQGAPALTRPQTQSIAPAPAEGSLPGSGIVLVEWDL